MTWYDIDYPEVIDVRGKLFPERENYRMIGSSVTAPEWLEQVPADLPTLIVAEGLTMYLRPEEGHELFRRLTDRFPRGVIAFDVHNWSGIRLVNKALTRAFGAPFCTGVSMTRTNWNGSTRGCIAPTRSALCPHPAQPCCHAARGSSPD